MKSITALWKEFNPAATKSMKEDFAEHPSVYLKKIMEYLDNGQVFLMSFGINTDVFTGEYIQGTRCIMTDGEYSWPGALSYYVEKYNLKLPKEFEDKILHS